MLAQFKKSTVALAALLVVVGLMAAAWGRDRSNPADHAMAAAHDAPAVHGADSFHAQPKGLSRRGLELHDAMRKLWEDHVTWTRLFIISATADLPDKDATAGRLLQNQADLGEAVAAYYGDAAGAQLTALLREHILLAADILAAAKAGDTGLTESKIADWYANADEIADFLSAANPAWKPRPTRAMMREHLDLTLEEAVARLNGDYPADIAAYERVHLAILEMADMLTDGIIKQFPDKFD